MVKFSSDREKEKKQIVIVKGYAGLGNRISALLTAILYSKITNRTLIVDWSDEFYSNDGKNTFHELFRLKNIKTLPELPASSLGKTIYPAVWENNLNLSVLELIKKDKVNVTNAGQQIFERYSMDFKRLNYIEDILVACSYVEKINLLRKNFSGNLVHLKKLSTWEILKKTYKENLEISPHILEKAQGFITENFANNVIIGIHVRQSDIKIGIHKYKKAIDDFLEKNPGSALFVATDNSEIEINLKERYGRIITINKWLPKPGEKIHGNPQCPDLSRHAVESLIDLYVLAQCNYIIYSRRTSFGRTAVLMSDLPANKCFDIDIYEDQRPKSFQKKLTKLTVEAQTKLKHIKARMKIEIAKIRGI